jgi:hypothetical protein
MVNEMSCRGSRPCWDQLPLVVVGRLFARAVNHVATSNVTPEIMFGLMQNSPKSFDFLIIRILFEITSPKINMVSYKRLNNIYV